MGTIAITGGTGFVGTRLAQALAQRGDLPLVFSRKARPAANGVEYAVWDPVKQQIDEAALCRANAVVHLAGAGVTDHRWTESYKREIRDSRVAATDFLVGSLLKIAPEQMPFIAASATGFYGPDKDSKPFTEDAAPAADFLGDVCRQWEASSVKASVQCRTIIMRFGIVLGQGGGAYKALTQPMQFGIMPVLGNGRQMVSWIHVDDLVRMILFALDKQHIAGVYNAVAPHPVNNKQMMQAIAQAKGGIRIPAPAPDFLLRMIMGESAVEVLKSCTVSSSKIQQAGFEFSYPDIASAAAALEADKH